jgi:SSS family solute:Na+ symporter
MRLVDFILFGLYMACVLAIGYYYFRKNKNTEDYYVGGRRISPWHVGVSVVATDVGGGFSIGLGGLGYVMGLSGSWMLFTGLLGAWLVAVFVIPILKGVDAQHGMLTYPDFLRFRFGARVAMVAALISGIGYMGFTGAQALAGAKLAAATVFHNRDEVLGLPPLEFSLYAIALITILYTVLGGLKAVIYTDTVQWIILLFGLIVLGIPFTIHGLGWDRIVTTLPPEFFRLDNFDNWLTPVNWLITIVPIWLVGMTLYQRMYAVKGKKEARKAWFIAGLFEWPVMAFTGVFLGMCSRVLFPNIDSEMGLPMLIITVLPIGVTGIVIASYFSAIMSTADSCLMASSGNFVNDMLQRIPSVQKLQSRPMLYLSMAATSLIGISAVILAMQFDQVLDAMLYAYGFMVGGLFVPTFGAYFWKRSSQTGALWGMLAGGTLTASLQVMAKTDPRPSLLTWMDSVGLDPVAYGIVLSTLVFVPLSLAFPDPKSRGR